MVAQPATSVRSAAPRDPNPFLVQSFSDYDSIAPRSHYAPALN